MKKTIFVCVCVWILLPTAALSFEFKLPSGGSDLPQWVSNPVADDADYIYGIGDGRTLATATQSALNNISGKLATVVSGNISSNTTLSQGKTSVFFSEDVSAKTFDTRLTNYEVVHSTLQDGVYYAMVKMSRSAFVADTKARLKIIDDKFKGRLAAAYKVSKLQYFLTLNAVKPEIQEASTLVLLLQAASPSFDGEKYLLVYGKLQTEAEELLYKLHIWVEAEVGMTEIADMIARLLGEKGVSASVGRGGVSDAVVGISGGVQRNFLFSEYSTQLRVNIQIRDKSGRRINSKEHVVAGSSLTSYDAAMRTAVNLLQQKIEEEGVFVVLGLQSN